MAYLLAEKTKVIWIIGKKIVTLQPEHIKWNLIN